MKRLMLWKRPIVLFLAIIPVFLAVFADTASGSRASAAEVADDLPMVFAVVCKEMACDTACIEWISAEGTIESDTAIKFKAFIKGLKGRTLSLVIQSNGGNLKAAVDMGHLIYNADLPVYVGSTRFVGCGPRDEICKHGKAKQDFLVGSVSSQDAYCYSACPLLLAAGSKRRAGPFVSIGVHQIWQDGADVKGHKAGERIANFDSKMRVAMNSYWRWMGVDEDLTNLMALATPDGNHFLSQADLARLKLVNAEGKADDLMKPNLCTDHPETIGCVSQHRP